MDVWYVERRSFRLDPTILARIVAAVVRRDGISADGHVPPYLEGTSGA